MSAQLQVTGEAKIRDLQGPVVANAGVITALDGLASQYVRGDGTLADVPSVTGGGASVSYYLNGSVNQGTFGGSTYYQMSKNAITGTGTNFSTSTNGLIAQFITDANDPDLTEIPSGNWNIEFYMGVSASSGSLASFYAELYKYDGTTFTLIASSVGTPELITNTTTVSSYFSSIAVPTTTLAETDRIAIRVYADVAGKTVTMYTEDNRLCQVVTTFSRGMLSLNSLTDQQQYLTVGTDGTDFNIVSSVDTHTFNIPSASASNRGLITTGSQTIAGAKTFSSTATFNTGGVFNNWGISLYDGAGSTALSSSTLTGIYASKSGSITDIVISHYVPYDSILRFSNDVDNFTYTFPDESGTIALLEANQNITGFKQFSDAAGTWLDYGFSLVKGNTPSSLSSSKVSVYSNSGDKNLVIADTFSSFAKLQFQSTGNLTYTFPDLSGTIALLEGNQTFTGDKTFSNTITFADYALMNIGVALAKTSGTPLYASTNGYANLQLVNAGSVNSLYLNDGDTGKFTKLSFNNAADYTYTFPALSGTLALLEGTQTFSGSKTFNSITNFNSGVLFNAVQNQFAFGLQVAKNLTRMQTGGYMTLSANSGTGSSIMFSDGDSIYDTTFYFDNTANREYTFPSASGTIALTSDLGNYVTLGTAQTITGAKIFTSNIEINKSGQAALSIVSTSGNSANIFNYVGGVLKSAISTSDTDFRLISSIDNVLKFQTNANFVGSLIFSNSANYSYTFPSASGTLALTSNLSSYLTLAGGTLTGQLYVNTGGSDNQLALVGTAPSLRLTNAISGATINGFIAMSGAANNYIQGSVSGDMCIGNQNNGKILFGFGAGTATPKVTIDSTGAATFSSSVTANSTLSAYYGSITSGNTPATSGTTPVNPMLNLTNNRGIGMYFGGKYSGDYAQWIQVSDVGNLSVNYPLLLNPNGGNVGIGTSSPLHKLTIAAPSSAVDARGGAYIYSTDSMGANLGGQLFFGGSYTGTSETFWASIAGRKENATDNNVAGYLAFATRPAGGSNTERMRITSGGNVGIGTSDAVTVRLRVKGASATSSDYALYIENSSGTNTFYVRNDGLIYTGLASQSPYNTTTGAAANAVVASDGVLARSTSSLKYKKNVKDYDKGLDIVNKIRPVFYESINEREDGIQYAGLIAEEIHDLGLTEFVQYATDGTPDALSYQNMVALAFKAIQEQQVQIEELKALINK